MKSKTNVILAGVVLALAGCATQNTEKPPNERYEADPRLVLGELRSRQETQFQKIVPSNPVVIQTEAIWVDKRSEKIATPTTLPAVMKQQFVIASSLQSPSFQEIGSLITKATGLPVGVAADLAPTLAKTDKASKQSISVFPFEGPLVDLLTVLASQNNAWWRWSGDRIEFYQYETKTFSITAPTGQTDVKASLQGSSSSGGAGGGGGSNQSGAQSNQGANFSSKTNFWAELKGALSAYKSGKDGSVTLMESLNTVTIRETPSAMAQMSAYISQINERAVRQVQVRFDIYLLNSSTNDNYGINWSLINSQLSARYRLFSQPNPQAGTTAVATIVDPNSKWNNSTAVLSALNTQGNARLLTSGTVLGLNGRVVPVGVLTETSYLASVSSNAIANAGSQVSLTPGLVTAGINSLITPMILDNGDILLDYKMDLSSLDALDRVSSGGQTIQVPTKSSRTFYMTPQLRSGESVVIAGFEQSNASVDKSGPLTPNAWLLGGNYTKNENKSTLVIVVTPTLVGKMIQ